MDIFDNSVLVEYLVDDFHADFDDDDDDELFGEVVVTSDSDFMESDFELV